MEHIDPPTYNEVKEIAVYALQVAIKLRAEVAALRMLVEYTAEKTVGVTYHPTFASLVDFALADELALMSAASPYLAQIALAVFAENEKPPEDSITKPTAA